MPLMAWEESRFYPSAEIAREDWDDPAKQKAFLEQMSTDLVERVRHYGYRPLTKTYVRSVEGNDPVTVTINVLMGRETSTCR